MKERFKLKTGQINFESTTNPGAYSCVVIKNGVFQNLTEELRKILIDKLQPTTGPVTTDDVMNAEDMF